jgi:hypothetical protein
MTQTKNTQADRVKQLVTNVTNLYVRLEMDRVVKPANSREEALQRLCLYAREYYERTGGLPVHIFIHHNGAVQVIDPETDLVEPELLKRVLRLIEDAVEKVQRVEYRCQSTLSTLEHSCERCTVLRGRDYEIITSSCSYRNTTCVYDFAVEVHLR